MSGSLRFRMKFRTCANWLILLERVEGIEPSYSAWKAAALPLSYTRAGADLTRHAGGLNPPRRSRPNILGAAGRPVPGP